MTILRQPLRPTSHQTHSPSFSHTDSARSIAESAELLEMDGALAAAKSAWLTAIELDNTPRSRIEFAGFLARTRQYDEATSLFDSLLSDPQVLTRPHLRSVVRHNLAAVLRQIGDTDRAASLQQMANRDRLVADGELTADELTASALDAINVDDLATAQNLLQRAVLIERNLGNLAGEAADCGNLAMIAAARDDRSSAIALMFRACSLHRGLSDWYSAGRDLLLLSDLLREIGRLSLATRCAQRAKQYFSAVDATEESEDASHLHESLQRELQLRRCNPLLN